MISTSNAANAALVEEVWGVTLMRYLSVMGMVLVHYDFLLTLDDEVCLVFLYLLFHPPHRLVVGVPRLAGVTSLAKGSILYKSLRIRFCDDILQLPSVA